MNPYLRLLFIILLILIVRPILKKGFDWLWVNIPRLWGKKVKKELKEDDVNEVL